MNLAELVDVVSEKTGLAKTSTRDLIKNTLGTILTEVKKGGRVSIVGFGAFYQSTRKARTGRNPQTGETITIACSKVPRFKAGKAFRDTIKKSRKVKE
jgi:DNA-binding protein HU-beta